MQISARILLNSAENILRDRQRDAQNMEQRKTADTTGARPVRTEGLSKGALESRLLKLQASLSHIQKDYSFEQTRLAYLTEAPQEINAELLFDGEALFPEWREGINAGEIENRARASLDNLLRNLKRIQVEMENLYALDFPAAPRMKVDAEALSKNNVMTDLNPSRVARLTRD